VEVPEFGNEGYEEASHSPQRSRSLHPP